MGVNMIERLIFSEAFAQSAGEAARQPSLLDMLILPVGIFLIMYLLLIRPQQRKMRQQQELIQNLKAGDEVVTSGGIIGHIRSVADQFVTLEIAGNTSVKVLKQHIQELTKKPAPGQQAVSNQKRK